MRLWRNLAWRVDLDIKAGSEIWVDVPVSFFAIGGIYILVWNWICVFVVILKIVYLITGISSFKYTGFDNY